MGQAQTKKGMRMEKRIPVSVYQVLYVCDECGKGVMAPTGTMVPEQKIEVLGQEPEKHFQHKCQECGHTEAFQGPYPYTALRPIGRVKRRKKKARRKKKP